MPPLHLMRLSSVALAMTSLWACGGPNAKDMQYWEDPSGRRDPVDRTCDTGVDTVEVGTEPTCADLGIAAGDPCTEAGLTCIELRPLACANDPSTVIASDQVLTCGQAAPDATCPISHRAAKKGITYLDGQGRRDLAQQALDLHLARYEYRDPAHDGVGAQVGYILEDSPDAVFSGTDHVNLYAYTSAVLAAVQEQQAEIARLQAEIDDMKAEECR